MVPTTTSRLVQALFEDDARVSDPTIQRSLHLVSAESQVPKAGPSRDQPAPIAQTRVNPILDDDFPRSHVGLGKYVVKCFFYLLSAYTQLPYVYSVTDDDPSITL